MPSLTEIMEVIEPIIDEKVATAVLAEREFVLQELARFLDRDPTPEQVRRWCEANVELLEYVRESREP